MDQNRRCISELRAVLGKAEKSDEAGVKAPAS
jgi:hypothetical protein